MHSFSQSSILTDDTAVPGVLSQFQPFFLLPNDYVSFCQIPVWNLAHMPAVSMFVNFPLKWMKGDAFIYAFLFASFNAIKLILKSLEINSLDTSKSLNIAHLSLVAFEKSLNPIQA